MSNKTCNNIINRKESNDRIYTPKNLAIDMIKYCDIKPTDNVLDPSFGGGVFYNNLPECNKDWCEIDKGRDFFEYTKGKKYDLVIGNPPYSLWNKWIKQTIEITDKFCYVFGVFNLTIVRLQKLHDAGFRITKLCLVQVKWWFSNSFIVIFEKNKKSIIDFNKRYYCDVCNKVCKRGRTIKGVKQSFNICTNI